MDPKRHFGILIYMGKKSMAWGFPLICTPESGYYETPYRRNVFHLDLQRSIEVLRELQYMSEAGLKQMADEARVVVERDYTWEKFSGTVFEHLARCQTPAPAPPMVMRQ